MSSYLEKQVGANNLLLMKRLLHFVRNDAPQFGLFGADTSLFFLNYFSFDRFQYIVSRKAGQALQDFNDTLNFFSTDISCLWHFFLTS